jgi:hypothetical protein
VETLLDPPAIKKKKKAYVKAYLDALYQSTRRWARSSASS